MHVLCGSLPAGFDLHTAWFMTGVAAAFNGARTGALGNDFE